eukprot:scaffold2358_cov222-Skeletonema_menzelii.AAC.2
MGELLSDNIYTGNHRQRSRSRSVSRRRGSGMAGRGGSVKSKDIKVVDLSSMEAFRGSTASPTNTGKKTVATELSSSTEESQMRINRAHDHIHKQQMLEDQRQKQQQLDRGRSRSQSRPRERKSVTNNGGRDSRSRSRPRTKSTVIHSDTSRFAGDTSTSKESSLNRAKALLEKMEQQETAKTASSSRGRTRSPPSSRGRSKSRPRIRPDDDDDLGSRIAKLVDDANRHRSRSRPRQKQQEQHQHKRDVNQLQQEQHQHKRDVNQQQRQQQRSGRSRSRPPHSNDARSVRSISRPQEKKSERGEDRRRSRSEKPDSNRQHRGSLRQSMTSHDDRKLEYLEKQLRKVQVKETIPKSKQLGHKQRRSSNHSSREDHKTLKHHQHDRNRSEKQDGRRNSAARHRSKSPVAEPKRESRLARPKSPYSPGSPGRNVGTSKSKSSAGSKSPYPYQEDDEVSSQSCDSSHDSRDDSDEDDAQESEDEHPQKPKVDKNGCCIYHSFVQLQKKENGGGWTILSRVCAICDKQAREKQTQHGGEQVSLIYVPGGHADELPPRRSGSRQSMVKQGSVPVNRKPAKGESSLTVSVLESDSDEDSSSSSSTDNASDDDEKEDDSTSVNESRRRSSRSMQKNQTEKSSYDIDKIISSADELLDELMYTEISMEDINEEEETDNRGKTARNVNKEKDQKKSSPSGKKSSRNKKPNDGKIDMSKVESALQQIRSRTPPPKRRPTSDTVDPGKARTPPPSHKFVSKPLAPKQQQSRPPPPPPPYQHGQSMAVLNPDPEPELIESELLDCPAQHNYQHQMHAPTMYQIQEPEQQQVYHEHQSYAPELQHPPNSQHQPAQDDKDSDWTKYAVKCSARNNEDASKKKERRKIKISGKVPDKLSHHESRTHLAVKDMPFTDTFGDFGVYTGQVNENGRPDGKGSMKYNNGIFYEGTWTDGSQDEKAATQYDRIRGGFTSWGGKGKVAVKSGQTLPWNAHRKDRHDENEKTNVRGMEWVDLNGDAGRYTGEVNKDELPHGKGIMKYNYGLIAEGEWVSGVLKENPQDRMIAAASGAGGGAVSVMGGPRSVIGGGMSVGPGMGGGMSVGPMLRPPMVVGGGMSVGPGMSIAQGSVYGMPQMMMQPQQVIMMQPQPNTAQQHTLIAQQNAVMKMCSPPSSVYGGGAGSVYGGSALMTQQQMPVNQQQLVPTPNIHTPPIKEITLG